MKNLLILILVITSFTTLAQTDSADYFLQEGIKAKSERRWQVAQNHFQKSVLLNAGNTAAHKELGLVYAEQRKYDLAKQSFTEVLKKNANDAEVNAQMANLYFWTRKWNEAIQYAKKAQELKTPLKTNYIIGKSYYEMEDYGQAFPYLQNALKEEPANAEIPYIIGRSFVDMSNYRSAAPYFVQAIQTDTTKPRWIYETALNFAAIPDDVNAIKYYELAAARGYKTDNDYYENLSVSYLGLGQADKCIEAMKKVLEKKPADVTLLYGVADVYYKIGKYQDAIDYWDKILLYDKKNARALYMIGMAYQKKGDTQKGQQLCDQAIAMDPTLKNMRTQKMQVGL
jgi:tetratricopeptide (TPR) repeat protein